MKKGHNSLTLYCTKSTHITGQVLIAIVMLKTNKILFHCYM